MVSNNFGGAWRITGTLFFSNIAFAQADGSTRHLDVEMTIEWLRNVDEPEVYAVTFFVPATDTITRRPIRAEPAFVKELKARLPMATVKAWLLDKGVYHMPRAA